ncbi:putative protein phosphatase 2C 55 [Abeliophyllum distichum]|uniref:Protein phosphatase n=1 Tax=Abeliophyllum distichum TaxID=126358 RepID=A0ABD1NP11_9LAMI
MDCSGSTRSILSVKETVSCTDSNLKMISAAFYIPKNNPLKPLGDDAHFICELEQTIGVADGVDGWDKKGIDAGIYARNLMSNAADSVRDEMKKYGVVIPKRVLTKAFLNTKAEGSSTACIITLQGEFLHCANVGDSKFVLIRENKIVFRSPVQQSKFNCPYQLGKISNTPSVAEEFACKVQEGDVIIAGTDGLFDNVDEKELETLVFMGLLEDIKPEVLAKKIAMFAHAQAQDPCACTPFQRESIRAGFQRSGGKYDDITVVVALIMSTSMAAWSPVWEATPTEFCGEAFDDSPGSWFYFSHPSVTLPLYDLPFSLDGPDLLFPSRCPLNDYTN